MHNEIDFFIYPIVHVTIFISTDYTTLLLGKYIIINKNNDDKNDRPQKSHYLLLSSSVPRPKFN